MIIIDQNDGDGIMIGKIKDCSSIHNVLVSYDGGGFGILCFDEMCAEYDGPHQITEMSAEMRLKRSINIVLRLLTKMTL